MNRLSTAAVRLIPLLLFPSLAVASPLDDCRTQRGAAAQITACSEVIAGRGFTSDEKALAYRNRGRARVEAGALDQGLADLDAAIKLKAGDAQAYSFRAIARLGRGDTTGAIADYTAVIATRPAWASGYLGRGHAYLVNGMAREAIDDFTRAISANPKSPISHNNRGLAHKKAGDLDRAIDDFTAAVNLNPIYALAYNNRGYAYEEKGNKPEAVADFRRALLIDPSLTGAKQGLARLGAAGPLAAESEALLQAGQALVDAYCSGCHAVGRTGDSPHRKAPPFRHLHARHPMLDLREPLSRGIAAPHDEMPRFKLADADIDKIVAYINSLATPR